MSGNGPPTRYLRRFPRAAPNFVDEKLEKIYKEHTENLPPLPPRPKNSNNNNNNNNNVVGKMRTRREEDDDSSSNKNNIRTYVVRISTRKPWSHLDDLGEDLSVLKKEISTSAWPKPVKWRSGRDQYRMKMFDLHFDRPWKALHFFRWGLTEENFMLNFTWMREREKAVTLSDEVKEMIEREIKPEPEERFWDEDGRDSDDDKDLDDDSLRDDDSYFASYSRMSIHRCMIMDRERTGAYEKAILENPQLFRGKVVMDVGCGTGILSMFAAEAGASRVIAVEKSDLAETARQIVSDNGFDGVITVHQSLVEELDLPEFEGKVDVIVSEWMGYCLFFESMLGAVLNARDRFLRPDVGLLFPDSAKVLVHGISDQELHDSRLKWLMPCWEFDLEHFRSLICREVSVQDIPKKHVVTGHQVVHSFSLKDYQLPKVGPLCNTEMSLRVNNDFAGPVHGLAVSFSVSFSHGKRLITLSNSPLEAPTHWKQSLLLFKKPIEVTPMAEVIGFLQMRLPKDTRHRLDFRVRVGCAESKSEEEEEEPKVQKFWQR